MFRRVFLDNAATTPVDREVFDEMIPFFFEKYGNASSIHHFGQEARAAIDKARHQVAHALNARPNEITFTSGGTEANNLAIRGLCESNSKYGNHLITSGIEHPSVKNVCEDLEKRFGFEVTYLPVYEDGLVKASDVAAALRPETILVSIMTANNEIGTLQPVAEIGQIVRRARESGNKLWFHTDAVQALGKIHVDVEEIGCDLLTTSAHKIFAPKGSGALYVKRGVRLQSQILGGHQERERRGGTENVANIAAFGKACEIASNTWRETSRTIKEIRDRFENLVLEMIPDAVVNGSRERRLPGLSNISFPGVEGEAVLINLDLQGIAVSTGSACSSGSLEPSPVILALGQDETLARGSVRFSFGRQNSPDDADYTLKHLITAVENLRRLSGYSP